MKNLLLACFLLFSATTFAQRLEIQTHYGSQQQFSKNLSYRAGTTHRQLTAYPRATAVLGLSVRHRLPNSNWVIAATFERQRLRAFYAVDSETTEELTSSFRLPPVAATWVGNAFGLQADYVVALTKRWRAEIGLGAELDRFVPQYGGLLGGNPAYRDYTPRDMHRGSICCFGPCNFTYGYTMAAPMTDVALSARTGLAYQLTKRIALAGTISYTRGLRALQFDQYQEGLPGLADTVANLRRQTLGGQLGVRYTILR